MKIELNIVDTSLFHCFTEHSPEGVHNSEVLLYWEGTFGDWGIILRKSGVLTETPALEQTNIHLLERGGVAVSMIRANVFRKMMGILIHLVKHLGKLF